MKATVEEIERTDDAMIYIIRGHKVMLDQDLARIYGVTTARLNEQVKRNLSRFPPDFMFQLTENEFGLLMSQIATSKKGRGGRRKMPYAFTEHGAVMLASVLNSPVAVNASIAVVKAFVRLREMLATSKELAAKLSELEERYDGQFAVVFDAIRQLMGPPREPRKQVGYRRSVEEEPV